jgi:hypothetical protein
MTKSDKTPARNPVDAKAPAKRRRDGRTSTRDTSKPRDKRSTTQPALPGESKLGMIVTMLRSPKGACIADLCKATGWQAHSVRGAISGAIKKRLKIKVTSTKRDGLRVYHAAK